MAETFRRSKVEHYIAMLTLRRTTLKQQLEQEEYGSMRSYLQGQLSAIELILNELSSEFALCEPFAREPLKREESNL